MIAVVDSNSDPDGLMFPVPGNDDAIRAISLYCDLFADAVLDGLQQELLSTGKDVGEAEEVVEPAVANGSSPAAEPAQEATGSDKKADEPAAAETAEAASETPKPAAEAAEPAAGSAETAEPAAEESPKAAGQA